jgi:metal-responsive CopG/Arc/MetJ family transcriptional regulator
MAKSTRKKTRRRSYTKGNGVPIVVRMHDPLLSEVDEWIGDLPLSRPEALRQLAHWALTQAKKRTEKRKT